MDQAHDARAGDDAGCHRTRLAESPVAQVDVCSCGVMQVHVGAVTLRMAPGAVSELLATLGTAVARHAGHRLRAPNRPVPLGTGRPERGEA